MSVKNPPSLEIRDDTFMKRNGLVRSVSIFSCGATTLCGPQSINLKKSTKCLVFLSAYKILKIFIGIIR